MRYFIRLAYRGSGYHGWQTQPNAISIQSELERALSTILRTPIQVTGAGRTDTGVNARTMWAHIDWPEDVRPLTDPASLIRGVNSILGPNIVVYELRRVHPDAHARFDATSRTYRYFTHSGRDPFVYPLSWQEPPRLDFDSMNRAAALLLHTSDFTSFAKLHSDAKTNICNVTGAAWKEVTPGNPSRHMFEITADRFLRNMVRAVVGTLIDVGRGKLSIDNFHHIIDARDRCMAGTSMPAHPLFLWDVTYPSHIFIDNPDESQ